MRIGIISEGHADRAVIENILIGLIGIENFEIQPLRPIINLDETDKSNKNAQTFSSWSIVKDECEKRELIDGFLAFEGQDFIVIHIDTAEAELYGIKRPEKKKKDFCLELRNLVVTEIRKWLEIDLDSKILHAVAIEEIDAWIMTIYSSDDSASVVNAKEKLGRILSRQEITTTSNYDNYLLLSKKFSKLKDVVKGGFLKKNCSLNAFCEEVKTKVLPAINISKV